MNVQFSAPQKLKALFVATVLGAAAIEGTVLAQQHHVHTGKDAFLHYQVDSTDELIAALQKNPTLRANYAKHFGIPQDQVIDFIKRTLVTYRLPSGRAVTTYGVTKAGMIYPVKTYLKKGTMVWATRSGLPILKWACANPLTTHIPGTLLSEGPTPATPKHRGSAQSPLVAGLPSNIAAIPTVPGSAGKIAVPVFIAPVGTATSALMLPPAPVLLGSGAATTPAVAAVPVPTTGGSNHGSNLLPLIPVLIGAGAVATHSGGNSGSGSGGGLPIISPATKNPTPITAVPVIIMPTPSPTTPSGGVPTAVSTPAPISPVANIPTTTPTVPVSVPTIKPTIPVLPPAPTVPVAVPTPTAPSFIPTPTPTTPVAIPTPAPTVPVAVPTSAPTVPVAVPTPAPTVPVLIPTPAPTVPVAVPTPAPTAPIFQPTPSPTFPTASPTPGNPGTPGNPTNPQPKPLPIPSTPNVPGGKPTATPEPGSFALALLAGVPVFGGMLARRRKAA